MPSFRYTLDRFASTVFGLMNSAVATPRFVIPVAAVSWRRSLRCSWPRSNWA